ncbi:SusC/RagA family TonB-linked outer membrane protein [Rubrolithibacter danxiaensis]|uniref:SusC/RagA family TonB-linked outer membrane protein n=1 Tax=Rubrolithibacter danxiaensis TaxID=3390805 RepID=UPI003BF7FDA3
MKKLLSSLFILLFVALSAIGQERTVSGTVTAKEDGLPLPGVSVKVKGTTIGTQTGADGNFSVRVPAGSNTLTFTYIGYATRDVAIGNNTTLNVVLTQDAKQLGEVVVTALGVSREKKAVGYAATTVKSEEINRASPTNLVQGLQGKVAGVDISTTSGAPGGSTKVVLRGFSSIAGNNQPLYVVDGVPINNTRPGAATPIGTAGDLEENFDFGNAANDINPNDIESVNILKGAAATSLYGSRGSNGVILITTKRGKAGAFKVDFSSAASFTQVSVVPQFQTKFGQGWDGSFILSENGSWGPRVDGQMRPWGAIVNNTQLLKPFDADKANSYRDAFDTGSEYNNTLALSGGNENSTFYLSYGNVTSDGFMPTDNDSYKRNTLSLSGSTKFKNFTAAASFNYVGKNSKFIEVGQASSGIGANFYEEVLQIPVDIPVSDFKDYKNLYFNVDNYFTPFAENPYYSLNENGSQFRSDRIYGNFDLKLQATDWLTFQFQQGADITNGVDKIWHAKNAPSPGSWNAGGNVEGYPRQADKGNVVEGSEKYFEYDSKLHALFNKKLSSEFDINGLIGLNYNDRGSRALYTSVEDLTIPGFYQLSNSLNSPVSTESNTHRRLLGAYATATLGYSNYAYLTLNARNDWSSTLPKGKNSYFYPSANLAVVLSDAFDLSRSKITLFKLRASVGQTGNDTDPYRIYNTLRAAKINLRGSGIVINFPVAGVSGFSINNTLNNGELRPEISTETEFGGEMRFFDNRIGFDLAYYNKITNDQILPVNISPSTGYYFMIVNFGKVRNRGIEFALNGTPLKNRNFNWDIGYTFTRNRNTVLELPAGLDKVVINEAYDAQMVARRGEPLGIIEAPVPQRDPQGRIIVNEDGIPLTASNLESYGSTQRDFIMGLTNSFSYKNLTLGFTFDWRKGGVFYSGTADLLNFVGNDMKTTYNDRKPFIIPNSVVAVTDDEGNVAYQENTTPIAYDQIDDYYYPSTNPATSYSNRILDKTVLKLRDVTLTYQLPKSLASKIRADRASLTVFGRNLWTWLPSENRTIDPEVSNFGNDLTSEFGEFRTGPTTRNFGATLRVSF